MLKSQRSRLGLGTVQFGLDYGISNSTGQVAAGDVETIVTDAATAGICVLDTAAAYGESESVLGASRAAGFGFRIITKTRPQRGNRVGVNELEDVRLGFENSLKQLGVESVGGLLVHDARDLLVPGGEGLYDQLCEWRQSGKVEKIGVSIYDRAEAESLFERYDFDLIQLPLNLFDQRLLQDGTISALNRQDVEIHVRSVFLQGVLLMAEGSLPPSFKGLDEHHRQYWHALRAAGIPPLAAALGFVNALPEVDVLLVGVNSRQHLAECLAAYDEQVQLENASAYAVSDNFLIDPRLWHRN